LRLIDLSKCYYASDEDVAVVELCPKLTHLYVGNTHIGITAMQTLVKHAKSLQVLSMPFVTSCDHEAFEVLFDGIRDARIASNNDIRGLRQLTHLNVSHNFDISMELLARLVSKKNDDTSNSKELTTIPALPNISVDVRFCDRLTQAECSYISTLSRGSITIIQNAKLRDNTEAAVRDYLTAIMAVS
jgi:hypothetical protein